MDVNMSPAPCKTYSAALCIWLSGIFFAMPLALCRMTGINIPLYGEVEAVSLPVLMTAAAGIILLALPRISNFFNKQLYPLYIISAIFAAVSFANFIAYSLPADNLLAVWFYPAAAAVGIMLAPECRKIFPPFALTAALIFIVSGFTSMNFTGLAGNWNWTQGIIAALLPGALLAFGLPCKRFFAAAVVFVFFIIIFICYPAEISRSAILASAASAIILTLQDRLNEKHFDLLLKSGIVLFILLSASIIFFPETQNTRIHFWQGAWGIILDRPLAGTGAGQFSEYIRHFLGESYYFSDLPAPHIAHAHNDLLNIFAENGIAGAIFYIAAIYFVLGSKPVSDVEKCASWTFVTLLFCGMFDQHNITAAGGTLLAFSAGIMLSCRNVNCRELTLTRKQKRPAFIAALLLFIIAASIIVQNFCAGSALRDAGLAQIRGNSNAAIQAYHRSILRKGSKNAFYHAAEMELMQFKRPAEALYLLNMMEKQTASKNHLHTRRLKALASYQSGNMTDAVKAFSEELKNAPASVINANIQRTFLRKINADPSLIKSADRQFLHLCQMRNISPDMIGEFSVREDDSRFPENVRREYWK